MPVPLTPPASGTPASPHAAPHASPPGTLPPDPSTAAPLSDASPDPSAGAGMGRLSAWPVVWAIAIGLVVTAIVSFVTDFQVSDLRLFAERLNPGWLLAAVAMLALRIVFGGLRLTAVSSGRLSVADGVRGQIAWDFFSNVTPSAVGGGPFTAAFVARDRGIPIGESFAILLFAMLVEQFWTLFSTLVVLGLLVAGYPILPPEVGLAGRVALGVFAAVTAIWTGLMTTALLRRPDWIDRGVEAISRWPLVRRRGARIRAEGHTRAARARVLGGPGPRFYLRGFVLASLSWIARYQMLVFLVWSVDPSADGPLVFLRYLALTMATMTLPTPGGAGGAEGFFALFIGPLVAPAALVTPLLIVWRLLGYYLFLVLGLPLAFRKGTPVESSPGAVPAAEGGAPVPASVVDSASSPVPGR